MSGAKLSDEQIAFYNENGYLLLENAVSDATVRSLLGALPEVLAEPRPSRVLEKDGKTVRSIYGTHMHDSRFADLARHPFLVRAARALLGSDVYVYQFKVNTKEAFAGDIWEWHQDYVYWEREDGLPRPDISSFVVFLDEVTEFNGPVTVVPKTHQLENVDAQSPEFPVTSDRRQPYRDQPEWIANLVARLKYSIDNATLRELTDRWGLVAPKGKAGSVLAFHSKLVHGSAPNISPYPRRVAIVTYCRTDNFPPPPGSNRPDFLCSRDHEPLKALDE